MRLIKTTALFAFLLAVSASATQFVATNEYSVASNQVVSSEQWINANSVTAAGTFRNDLFISSGSALQFSGTCEGNLWGAAGSQALLSGTCRRNVRLLSPTIRINGRIDGNLMAMANAISIGTNAVISGDVQLYGNQIIIEGSIGGELSATALQSATLSGTVQGNARVNAPEIILTDDARLSGDLTYTQSRELLPAENVVQGKLNQIAPESPYSIKRLQRHAMWFLAALLTGIPFIALFPMTTSMASILLRKSPLKCLVTGFAASCLIPFFGMLALFSGIGIPLGAVTLASWGILAYISRIIMGLMIGTLVLRGGNTSALRIMLAMATGLGLIYLFTAIPTAIGGMVQMLVVWMGMGALLQALLQKRRLIIQIPEELKQLEALKNEQRKPTEEAP